MIDSRLQIPGADWAKLSLVWTVEPFDYNDDVSITVLGHVDDYARRFSQFYTLTDHVFGAPGTT